MSQGRSTIQAILRDQSAGTLRLINTDFLLEEELPLYNFVVEHHGRYRVLPDNAVLSEHGFSLPHFTSEQDVAYHMDRLRDRFIFNTVNSRLPEITGGMQEQDMDVVMDVFREVLAVAGSTSGGNTVSRMEDEIRHVVEDYYIARNTHGLRGMTMGFPTIDAVTLGAMDGDLIVIAGRPALGKAQPVYSPVMTPTGWGKLGNLRVGDKVVTRSGEGTTVTGVFPQGVKDVYKITFLDLTTTECCYEHLWQVKSARWDKERVVDTKELERLCGTVRHNRRVSVPLCDPVKFPTNYHVLHPYVLGVLLAEGSLTTGRARWTIGDCEVTESMRRLAPPFYEVARLGDIDYAYRRPDGFGEVGKGKGAIRLELERLNLAYKKSTEKRIPREYIIDSVENRYRLIQGIMDGDGYVGKTGTVQISVSCEGFADDIREVLHTLGASVRKKLKKTTHADSFVLTIRHPHPEKLFTLERKLERAKPTQFSHKLRRTIASVEKVRQAPCVCIKVADKSSLYLTDHCIVTHNTNVLMYMAYCAWQQGHTILFISMEMGKLQIARRWAGMHTGLNPNLIRAGRLSSWGLDLLESAEEDMRNSAGRVYLESGDCSRDVEGVESMILQFTPEAVYVDAAYLLTISGKKNGYVSKWEQLAMVVGQLKQMALRYQIPIYITVQFNRNQKDKGSKEMDLGDIAGSDSIPQDASIVFGLKRAPAPYDAVRREAIMLKSREGDLVDVLFNYQFEPVNFSEIPWEPEEDAEAPAPVVALDWMVMLVASFFITSLTAIPVVSTLVL